MKVDQNLVDVKFKDGTVMLVEVTAAPQLRGQELSGGIEERLSANLDSISKTIKNIAEEVHSAISAVSPKTVEVEFGLDINAETGALLGQLVKGGGKASLKIKLVWEKKTA